MDHETSGAQEWILPGYGRVSLKNRVPSANQPGPSAPQTPNRNEAGQPAQGQASKPPNTTHPHARGGSRASRGRGASQPSRGQANAANRNSSRLFKDTPSKAKWRAGQEPNDFVQLPAPFGALKREFFGYSQSTAPGGNSQVTQGRYQAFEDIGRKTGAYVKAPAYMDKTIQLWGEPSQVSSAKDLLQRLVSKCQPPSSQKKKIEWAKIYAHNTNKEAGADWKEKHESMLQQLRKEPDSASALPEKLLFLWPREGPSITESLGAQLEALDMIRAKFGYFMYVPKDLPECICVLGLDQDVMRQIAWRLRTKWSEAVANCNLKSKVYFVEPPEPSLMKEEVIVKKHSNQTTPSLRGDAPTGVEAANWADRAKLIQSKNHARLLSAVQKSLKGASLIRGHLRMRVNLGTFVLDAYRRPVDDKPSYTFEGFREMLLHEQTKGRLIPGLKTAQNDLLDRCFKANDLLERYESTSGSLEKAEPTISVNFEFIGKNSGLLRLEAEFAKRPGAQQYEITQRRWLRPRRDGQSIDSRPPLQIGVVDFDRCDWQIEIKSLEFHQTQSIDAALRAFSHSIGFQCTTDIGVLTAKPKRKVTFPGTAPVSRFIEKTAIRYRLKGTQYILEIARYDEYRRAMMPAFPGQNPPTLSGPISEVPFTSWGASLFDSNWDNLLGQHANLQVGLSTRYTPDLDRFFPPKEQSDSGDKTAGFSQFLDLVKQVSELLGSDRVKLEPSTGRKASGADTFSTTSEENGDAASKKMMDGDLGTLF